MPMDDTRNVAAVIKANAKSNLGAEILRQHRTLSRVREARQECSHLSPVNTPRKSTERCFCASGDFGELTQLLLEQDRESCAGANSSPAMRVCCRVTYSVSAVRSVWNKLTARSGLAMWKEAELAGLTPEP
eukprot:1566584-Rhodomonas_salina.1